MIDFQNGSFIKMNKTNPDVVMKQIQPLLLDDENVIGVYKA